MKNPAIVFVGQNKLEVRDEPIPTPEANQVLVEATKTLISTGTEMICFQRKFEPGTHWDNWVKYPFYTGYSLAGRVVSVGKDVTELKEGDRVALRRSHRKYTVIDPANELMARIPDGITDEDATYFGIATITQNGVRRAEHKMGDTVVVIGMGILGQLVAQYVRLMGAREVIAVDLSDMRLRAAADFGATITLNKPVEEVKEDVLKATDGRLADVVYDVTGHPPVFQHALSLPRRFGKVILLGDAGTPSDQRLSSDVITRGVQILGTHDGHPPAVPTDENYWTRYNMAQLFFHYLKRGQVRVCDLTTHRFNPLHAEEAYHLLATDRMNVMGVLFDWLQV